MKCRNCEKEVINISKLQKKRNKNFFCSKTCYISYINRDKIKNIDFFKSIDSEEKAYWIGFIVADGNIDKKGNCLQINLSSKDGDHLQKLGDIFGKQVRYTNYYNRTKKKSYKGSYLSVTSKKLWLDINKLGVVPNKTESDQSHILKNIPDELFPHFIRGVFDGDGSLTYGHVEGKTICNFMICGEDRLMNSLKCRLISSIGISDTKCDVREKMTIIRWGGKRQCKAICEFMYNGASIYLRRKKCKYEEMCKLPTKERYFGVTKTSTGKYNASIIVNKKRKHIGNFVDEIEAAKAYDAVAIECGKPLYKINFCSERSKV